MSNNSLDAWSENVRAAWGPLTSELVEACQAHLQRLVRSDPSEPWLARLHRERPANEDLYRDPDRGFVLLAHTEHAGVYRPPHDHGRAWVIYAVQQGEVEMGTYGRIDVDGEVRLVRRNSTPVRAGDVQVYLPGDIHDTRCLSSTALLFRFTERDLRIEDRQAHRVTRYHQRNGVWTVGRQ